MLRQTSLEAYNKLKTTGALSKLLWLVYDTLFHHGPMTQNECWQKVVETHPQILPNSITPRFIQLKERGVVKEMGERVCRVTGENVLVWDVTNASEIQKIKLTKQQLARAIYLKAKGRITKLGFKVVWDEQQKGLFLRPLNE